jgi:hypothetical protein
MAYNRKNNDAVLKEFDIVCVGCPESTDEDVIVIVDEKYDVDTIEVDMDIVKHKLSIIGIDTDTKIDINIVHIYDGQVIKSKKGSIKTIQGIIYYTQNLHMPFNKLIKINKPNKFKVSDRIKPTINYILDHFKYFLTKDQCSELRDRKIKAYAGNEKDTFSEALIIC